MANKESRKWRRAFGRRYRNLLAMRAMRESSRNRTDRDLEHEFIGRLPEHLQGVTCEAWR